MDIVSDTMNMKKLILECLDYYKVDGYVSADEIIENMIFDYNPDFKIFKKKSQLVKALDILVKHGIITFVGSKYGEYGKTFIYNIDRRRIIDETNK